MRPDEDGTSAFSRVTGEQPLVPQIITGNFYSTQLSVKLHQLPFNYNPTKKREIKTHIPEELKWKSHKWLKMESKKAA